MKIEFLIIKKYEYLITAEYSDANHTFTTHKHDKNGINVLEKQLTCVEFEKKYDIKVKGINECPVIREAYRSKYDGVTIIAKSYKDIFTMDDYYNVKPCILDRFKEYFKNPDEIKLLDKTSKPEQVIAADLYTRLAEEIEQLF